MLIDMNKKAINRLKAVLQSKARPTSGLLKKIGKNETTISRWCTNEVQPSMDTFIDIAKLLNIDVKELINSTKR